MESMKLHLESSFVSDEIHKLVLWADVTVKSGLCIYYITGDVGKMNKNQNKNIVPNEYKIAHALKLCVF